MPDQEVIEEVVVDEVVEDPKQAEEDPTPEPKEDDKKPNQLQARIDKLTRERHEAERKAQFYEEALKAAQSPQEKSPEKPARADFNDDDAYIEALTDYKASQAAEKAVAKVSQAQAENAQAQAARTVAQTYAERAKAFEAATADFNDVMQAADQIRVSAAARDAILESDLGPQLAYHLAKHPDIAEKLGSMSPLAQVRELGRIEERLTTTKPTVATSKAPAPITPTRGTGGQFARDEASMKDGEWLAHYRKTYRT